MGVHVAFDIGNVLCTFDIHRFIQKLSSKLKISDMESLLFLEHLQRAQDIGITTVALSLKEKFNISQEEVGYLVEEWNATVEPHDLMLRFLSNIKDQGAKIAYLSNMGKEHIQHLRQGWPEMFANTIEHISCEVGARKPTKLFFQSFVLDHDEFKGAVYVDDLEENLKTGKYYSFKVFHFCLDQLLMESPSKQKIELDKLRRMIFDKVC